jgi:Uma2 family endonuclease
MATTAKLTLDEFLKLPETKPASELVDGEVVQKTMPTYAHAIIERLLSLAVSLFLREHPIGDGGPEFRCIFGPAGQERAFVPDFVFVTAERLQGLRGDQPFRGAPDLAVEILSPDDRWIEVMEKVRFYLENGVRLVWVINPEARTVMVMWSPSASRFLSEDETLDGSEVLPGFSAPVHDILPPPESAAS